MKKRIPLAIIGCGGFVRCHVEAIKKDVPEFELVAMADTCRANADKLAELSGQSPVIYDDHKKMLRAVKPKAVIVSTPHTLHFAHCHDALAAGAHVMVEKPMVTNSADARKLVRFAKSRKLNLQIAIQGTYTDTFAYARKLISDGTMGPLQLATGILGQGWMNGTRGMWRQEPKLSGGGQLYDSTAHVLSAMMFLVNSPAVEVFCWTDNKGCNVDINAVGTIRFANGCMATITSGGNCPTWFSHLIIQGAGAILEISPHGGSFRVNGSALKQEIKAVPARWRIRSVSPARNFADVILGKDKPRCTGELGIRLADLMDAFYRSAQCGKPASI